MDGEHEFNGRVIVFICTALFLIFAIFFLPNILEKPKMEINTTINITSVPTPIIQYVYVTPTPDNGIYYSGEYESGIRKLQRPFSFYRQKVLGEQDLSVHAVAYGYRIFDKYHWFNPMDYLYYTEYPSMPDTKFLFIFFNVYLDDIIGDDVRFWLPNQTSYAVQIGKTLYTPAPFQQQLRIKELEETFNKNDNMRIDYFNSYKFYEPSINNTGTAGETFKNIDVLKGGKSNAVDGYIVFEIPYDTKVEEISFLANFYTFGSSQWILKT